MCLILFLLNSGASLAHTCSLSALLMFLRTVLVQTSIHLIRPPPQASSKSAVKFTGSSSATHICYLHSQHEDPLGSKNKPKVGSDLHVMRQVCDSFFATSPVLLRHEIRTQELKISASMNLAHVWVHHPRLQSFCER